MDVSSLTQWMSTVFSRPEQESSEPDVYFTPRLAAADRQLRALAARLKGDYQRGALQWSALAAPPGPSPDDTSAALWGRGSTVTKRLHGLEIEVTVGIQPAASGQRGEGAVPRWLVLVPGVTVAAGPRSAPLRFDRFAASWSADEENATGADRLRDLLTRGAPPAAPPVPAPALPPSVASARERVIEKASKLVCAETHLFVIGRPVPRAPAEPRRFGHGDFEVDVMFDLVERSRALAHALASG